MLKIALISCHASPLAVAGSLDCGGINRYVAQLGCELGALGCQVDIFTRRHRLEQPQVYLWRPNVRVIHVPAGTPGPHNSHNSHSLHGGRSHARPPSYSAHFVDQFARAIAAFARRQRGGYHIMHAHDVAAGSVARQVRRVLGIPYVMTMHAIPDEPATVDGGYPQQQLAAPLLADADRIVALCRQQQQTLQTLCGAARDHIDIVPWGFDPAVLWPVRLRARAALGLDRGAFVALQVARVAPGHGIDTAMIGLKELAAQHGVRARLLLVGAAMPDDGDGDRQGGSELARLRALARQHDVAVTFAGPQPAVALRHWYSAADVYVATPRHASFGVTALEAMACATPVVGAAVGGITSTVVDGETGYLIPADNPVALADRLAWLHAHPAQARSLGVQGWRRAHRHYTWRSVARRITAIYARVVAGVAAEVAADAATALASSTLRVAGGGGDHGAPP
jgi:glycosyltransferase involved in cell wall biosynthesis